MSAEKRLVFTLPPDAIEAIAERAAVIVLERLEAERPATSPYLTVAEAAEFARCSRQRIYDLLSARRLSRVKDGSRALVRRDELEAWLAET